MHCKVGDLPTLTLKIHLKCIYRVWKCCLTTVLRIFLKMYKCYGARFPFMAEPCSKCKTWPLLVQCSVVNVPKVVILSVAFSIVCKIQNFYKFLHYSRLIGGTGAYLPFYCLQSQLLAEMVMARNLILLEL